MQPPARVLRLDYDTATYLTVRGMATEKEEEGVDKRKEISASRGMEVKDVNGVVPDGKHDAAPRPGVRSIYDVHAKRRWVILFTISFAGVLVRHYSCGHACNLLVCLAASRHAAEEPLLLPCAMRQKLLVLHAPGVALCRGHIST